MKNIAVLLGDGVSNEIIDSAIKVLDKVSELYNIKLKYEYTNKEEIILESNIVVSTYKESTKNKNTPKKTFWSVIRNLIFKIWNFIKKIFIFFKELI